MDVETPPPASLKDDVYIALQDFLTIIAEAIRFLLLDDSFVKQF
jgi:hypothetical protein